MHNILIIHTYGIGDWIFFSPVLKTLTETYPDVHIDVILGTPNAKYIVEFYKEVHIKEVVDVQNSYSGIVMAAIKTWHEKYDALIFTAGINSDKADKLSMLIRSKKKIGLITTGSTPRFLNSYSAYDHSLHRVENNLILAKLIGLDISQQKNTYLPYQNKYRLIPGSVLIHPGCEKAKKFKRWPSDRFAMVADDILKKGRTVTVILGPDELELAEAFSELKAQKKFTLLHNIPFMQVLDIVASHEIFLNSDSGLGHIAAALGKRTVTVFGPTNPNFCGPYGNNSTIITKSMALDCMPCYEKGRYGCLGRRCLTDIEVGDVLKVLYGY